ncbi:DsbA family protein [Streptomyces sp. DT224]|uniref:DsbA family protein n=1 Tax=unclassified Streptomyces TaxID=2593676 RepID=UPI0011CE94D5|nr:MULTISPECIES: thioredoxin domain-containing protein [unclassified Streptomyces]TXS38253.1 disulfide bond formation protein DsbA [Streptomyces sp. or43]WRZ03573.1 DsbA family protein [Streptomyces sp. NBC_00385]
MKKHLYVGVVILAALAAAFGSVLAFSPDGPRSASFNAEPAAEAQPVRTSSHRLTQPKNSELTVVEFLDFECEGCGAMHPVVERLREEYKDRVTFVARYFPMPGHRNSQPAAQTAEAAAQQGQFEAMYGKLFATQKEWGEAQESKAAVFRGYAKELGLDLKRYDAAVKDPKTAERVLVDQADGLSLGVQGTPTFIVDGVRVATPGSYEAFKALIDERLAQ